MPICRRFTLITSLYSFGGPYPAYRSQPAHRHHRAQENGHGQEGADRSPHPGPECDGEENEEWIDREPMTDEGRRYQLPLQHGDAEIGERRDDCLT